MARTMQFSKSIEVYSDAEEYEVLTNFVFFTDGFECFRIEREDGKPISVEEHRTALWWFDNFGADRLAELNEGNRQFARHWMNEA